MKESDQPSHPFGLRANRVGLFVESHEPFAFRETGILDGPISSMFSFCGSLLVNRICPPGRLPCFPIFALAALSCSSNQVPASNQALRNYLQDSTWLVTKRLDYKRGGSSGVWTGDAYFVEDASRPGCLRYTEQGRLTLDSMPNQPGFESAGKPLSYNLGADPIRVSFIETTGGLSFFHELSFDPGISLPSPDTIECDAVACSFSHLCVKDLYSGTMTLHDWEHFQLQWRVFGPVKDGRVQQSFRRLESRQAFS